MMLEHYSQTKCLLVSYDQNPMGFFYRWGLRLARVGLLLGPPRQLSR